MNKKILLGIILAIAFFIRVWQLGAVPSSPDWDEVALGYNAYSIMQTGRDEYGEFLPIVMRSFDDYKPALYTYFVIPFIALFGLTVESVRLPSVLFGVFTVLATYFLVKELFERKKIILVGKEIDIEYLALTSAFLLAISPWHIQFSRIAFETNGGLFLNVLTILFFLKGLKKHWYLVLSFGLGALNVYMYQSEKVFTPLIFLLLIGVFFKDLLKIKKWVFAGIIIAVIVGFPMLFYILTEKEALLRAQGTSIWADQTQFLKRNVEKLEYDEKHGDILGKVLDNRRVDFLKGVVSGYISHWDLNWLFITGDHPRHHAPFMGLLYLWELPFLFIGIFVLLFNKQLSTRSKIILFGWFLIVPIPASITNGVPHAVRTLNFLPLWQIFIAFGLISTITAIAQLKYQVLHVKVKYVLFFIYFLVIVFNITYYFMQYFVQQNYYYSEYWQYGYKEAIQYVGSIKNNYNSVVVENIAPLDQSYMFFLFYTKFPPEKYIQAGGTVSGGFKETHKGFDKFTFRPIEWERENKNEKILYVGPPGDFPKSAKVLKTIRYENGQPAIQIVEGT